MAKKPSLIKKADAQPNAFKMLVYGDWGTGKTSGALTFPNPIVIDTEGGVLPYAKDFQFSHAEAVTPDEIQAVLEEIAQMKHDGTIIVDSITMTKSVTNDALALEKQRKVAAQNSRYNTTKSDDLTMQDWAKRNQLLGRLYRTAMGIAPFLIVISREKTLFYQGEDGNEFPVAIGVAPDVDNKAPYEFDIVVRVYKEHTRHAKTKKITKTEYKAVVEKIRAGPTCPMKQGTVLNEFNFDQFKDLIEYWNVQSAHLEIKADPVEKAVAELQASNEKPEAQVEQEKRDKALPKNRVKETPAPPPAPAPEPVSEKARYLAKMQEEGMSNEEIIQASNAIGKFDDAPDKAEWYGKVMAWYNAEKEKALSKAGA